MSGTNNKSDIEVDEIKVILEQLQDLKVSPPEQSSANKKEILEKKQSKRRNPFILFSITAISAVTILGLAGGYIVYTKEEKVKPEPPKLVQQEIKPIKPEKKIPVKPETPPELVQLLDDAGSLIQQGKILSARKLLNTGSAKYNTEAKIPFMLAQTYDPNFLKTLSATDADAELGEAEKWYRQWDKLASTQKKRTPNVSLNTILQTLR